MLRRYRPGDPVAEIHRRALRAAGTDPDDVPGGDDVANVEGAYLETGGEFIVAEADGEVVAAGGYRPQDEETVELFRVAVAPDRQREGHGARLVAGLEERARADGYERVVLETAERQRAAVSFYPSLGYEETGRRRVGEYELVTFEKSLSGGE